LLRGKKRKEGVTILGEAYLRGERRKEETFSGEEEDFKHKNFPG